MALATVGVGATVLQLHDTMPIVFVSVGKGRGLSTGQNVDSVRARVSPLLH